jgi:haloacetate dehalogenase
MARHFDVGGAWAGYLEDYSAQAMPGGHFFVDYHPAETAEALASFWREFRL